MTSDLSSSYQSLDTSTPTPTEGPVPLPEESPFLSDHGLGTPAPPPSPRAPVNPPSGLSQFPPASALPPAGQSTAGAVPVARGSATQAIPRNPPEANAVSPAAGYGAGVQDNLSSFPFMAGGGDDPFGPSGRGSGSIPATSSGNELLDRLKTILVTTTDSLQGRLVEQYLGLVTAEAMVPTETLLEGAERTGRFSRYKLSQQKLKSLQQLVVAELKLEADKLGGNAVVGTKLNTTLDQGVVFVVATGTSVKVV
jgi:uncharacterized protein YbjQ (UPF0145 family)